MKKIFPFFCLVILVTAIQAQSELFLVNGEAIRGYDAVAYFKESKPVKGKKEFSTSWHGANWLFASKENKDTFLANPEKYAPQFGGYCSYGTADSHKAPAQPDAWSIVDDKLYLNYNKDVQVIWRKDQNEMIEKANKNWPEVKKQKD